MTASVFLLWFGALFIAVMALEQGLLAFRARTSPVPALLLVSVSCWQIQLALFAAGWYGNYPHLTLTHVPVLFASAPLFLFFMNDMLDLEPEQGDGRRPWLHFVPLGLALLGLSPFYLQSAAVKHALLDGSLGADRAPYLFYSMRAALFASLAFFLVYILVILKRSLFLWSSLGDGERPRSRFVVLLALGMLACIALALVGQAARPALKVAASIGVTALFIAIHLRARLDPEFSGALRQEVRTERYRRSRLTRLDLEAVLERLDRELNERKIYRDESLTMPMLANEIGVTTAQLSEIINTRFEKNFKLFVNEFRVKEAQELLKASDRSVLDVAFDVGFNSKSAFYAAFRASTGLSPVQFRRK